MKKFWLLLLSIFALAGCGTNTKTETPKESQSVESSVMVESTSQASQSSSSEQVVTILSDESDEAGSQAEATEEATITLSVDGEEVDHVTVSFKEGDNLLDVMKKQFDIDEKDGFIKSIDGHEQDEENNKYWLYDINGKMAEVGAGDYTLQSGDVIHWNLEATSF